MFEVAACLKSPIRDNVCKRLMQARAQQLEQGESCDSGITTKVVYILHNTIQPFNPLLYSLNLPKRMSHEITSKFLRFHYKILITFNFSIYSCEDLMTTFNYTEFQAQRQDSVTGGEGGINKFGGARKHYIFEFESVDQTKKVFNA